MIRKALLNDADKVNELGILINIDYEKLFKIDQIINDKYAKLYVYETDGLIKGFIHINELDEVIDIINIVVDPHERKKGIGTLLLDYVISEAKETVKMITLEVSENNKEAQKFYEKFGFEIINIRKNYYGKYDGYLMGRWIK